MITKEQFMTKFIIAYLSAWYVQNDFSEWEMGNLGLDLPIKYAVDAAHICWQKLSEKYPETFDPNK